MKGRKFNLEVVTSKVTFFMKEMVKMCNLKLKNSIVIIPIFRRHIYVQTYKFDL